ncbi:MAG: flavin reductase [Bacillota bacterium]|nr:flavin reductase [Bacillota bacterium]
MQIQFENFARAYYDVFALFNQRWALCTAGTPEEFNTMTIGWGSMGTIWGPAGQGRSILTVYLREQRYTTEILQRHERFTVSFFPEEYRRDLSLLGTKSGRDEPDKIALTRLTPRPLGNAVGFAEAELTFVCRKIYRHKMTLDELPDFARDTFYPTGNLHYLYMGEIEDAFGTAAGGQTGA